MTCEYRGCPFPTDTICRHHERLEANALDNPYSYTAYGTGRRIEKNPIPRGHSIGLRSERTHCRRGHFLAGFEQDCKTCRSVRDRARVR